MMLFRHFLFLSSVLILLGCSSSPNNLQNKNIRGESISQVTLSHVKAYLLIGNITKADERFQTIQTPELVPGAMLALAQLRAAKGDSLGAQQAFVFALDNQTLSGQPITSKLLDYFCQKKMWQALEGYGTNLLDSATAIMAKNASLSMIGQCFFKTHEWINAKYWLNQLDLMQAVGPLDFLALARLSIEDKQYKKAEQFMIRFEETKNNLNAHMLWTALKVYQGLQQPKRVEQIGQHLSALFPDSDYSLVYREMLKLNSQGLRKKLKTDISRQATLDTKGIIHIIKKGETLYQLSKRYGVTAAALMSWNPNLVIDDISIRTKIRILPTP
jgi:Tfp pilus assembly protein PilF